MRKDLFWHPQLLTAMCTCEHACTHTHTHSLTHSILSLSVPKIICLQSLKTEFTLQRSNWLLVTFKERKDIFPFPGTEYNSLKIEQCVFGVFFSSSASITGVQLQTQRARFTSSVCLRRIPTVTQGARTVPKMFSKKGK